MWLHGATSEAERFHQSGVPVHRFVPVTVGCFARYLDSPVGPYSEIWAAPTFVLDGGRLCVSVPFMAVDSQASLQGGRANWGLPKVLATFDREPWEATGPEWTVRARVVSRGARVPLRVGGHLLQEGPDGGLLRSRMAVRGTGRLARVRVETAGTAPPWLTSGRHAGLVLERATLEVGVPHSLRSP